MTTKITCGFAKVNLGKHCRSIHGPYCAVCYQNLNMFDVGVATPSKDTIKSLKGVK